jgi:hypothetical protein
MSADSAVGSSGASPAPAATPKPPPGPSATARCIAKHLQSSLKDAKLDDAIMEKIAGDIDGYLDLGKDFRAKALRNSDEPDSVFSAVQHHRSRRPTSREDRLVRRTCEILLGASREVRTKTQ